MPIETRETVAGPDGQKVGRGVRGLRAGDPYEENMAEVRQNLAESERILRESEKNKEAIDAWLNRRASDQ
jgi:hypothetical protein